MAPSFPGGAAFTIGVVQGNIIIWGGCQMQEDGIYTSLPMNKIHIFDLKTCIWKSETTSGEIHAFYNDTVGVVLNDKLYVFGGHHSS